MRDRDRLEGGVQNSRDTSVIRRKQKQAGGRLPLRPQSPLLLERSEAVYDREFPRLRSVGDRYNKQALIDNIADTEVKRFVSFYFTNVPEFIPYVNLRQGFEVCGILEDLYVTKNYNAQGKVYGFVRFGKVKNVAKLTKALNEVRFGVYRVFSKVARFDRFAKYSEEGGNQKGKEKQVVEGDKKVSDGIPIDDGGVQKEGKMNVTMKTESERGRGRTRGVGGVKIMVGDVACLREGKKVGVFKKDVGGVADTVKLRKVTEKVIMPAVWSHSVGAKVKIVALAPTDEHGGAKGEVGSSTKFIIKYRPNVKDVDWDQDGVVAIVSNGESIPVLQQRILDVGFKNLNIIPMGADKVLLKASGIAEVNSILSGAAEFFNSFFSSTIPWKKDCVKFERGAWIRLYGIRLQAWNDNFFRLCVFDFGRVMRVDLSTVDRDRLDYARILIATSSLDIIHSAIDVLIDEDLVNIKIVEERGCSIGDDVCLFEEESVIDANDNMEENVNFIENNDGRDGDLVDNLVNDISKEFMEKERSSCHSDEKSVVPKATMDVQQHFQAMDKDEDLNVTPPLCHVSRETDDNNLMAATTSFQCDEINKNAEAGFLMQFRCVCKSWNNLISNDLRFAKKHLSLSAKHKHIITTAWSPVKKLDVMSFPFNPLQLDSIFTTFPRQLEYSSISPKYSNNFIASCDGLLCFAIDQRLSFLWNPSIRKLKKLPHLEIPRKNGYTRYAFGYDPFICLHC